jgi:hypothetical protein
MATSGAWIPCTCGHLPSEHGPKGKCRAESAAGWPCECESVDVDDPAADFGPTVQPVPGADGSMGWLIVHHSLDGREATET